MNLPMLKKWVAALRSGKYQQVTGRLLIRTADQGDKFCCLGVVQDLYAKSGKGHWETDEYYRDWEGFASLVDLTMSVLLDLFGPAGTTLGLCVHLPDLQCNESGNQIPSLVSLNDDGFTFDQIADIIEYFFIKPQENSNEHTINQAQ